GKHYILCKVGFKSYEIERCTTNSEEWFEWTERGRNLIRRTTFSRKSMLWLCDNMKEASKVKGNYVKRWKTRDRTSETYCTRNFNSYGRCISIIGVIGRGRSVIIVPEAAFNAGWLEIALKIERFIKGGERRNVFKAYKEVEEGLQYSNIVRNHKWVGRELNDAKVNEDGGIIHISGNYKHNELLGRCLVGFFPEDSPEIVTLSEVRKWASYSWKQTKEINIYEMDKHRFLFEFSSKATADQVLKIEWFWKKL
ncbi:hypothetical protein A4A49_56351, partial [Nicotiana attenuata]